MPSSKKKEMLLSAKPRNYRSSSRRSTTKLLKSKENQSWTRYLPLESHTRIKLELDTHLELRIMPGSSSVEDILRIKSTTHFNPQRLLLFIRSSNNRPTSLLSHITHLNHLPTVPTVTYLDMLLINVLGSLRI